MIAIKTLAAAAAITVALSSDLIDAWAGSVTFYENTFFSGKSLTVNIATTHRCFNIDCFKDRASSARWANLPPTGWFDGHSRIVFYKDKDCGGVNSYWKTTDTYFPENFKRDGINDAVSSFMIEEKWSTASSGKVTVCPSSSRTDWNLVANITVSEADAVETTKLPNATAN